LKNNILKLVLAFVTVELIDIVYIFIKVFLSLKESLYKTEFYTYILDTFVTQTLLFAISLLFLKTSGLKIKKYINFKKKNKYLFAFAIISGITLAILGRWIFSYFSQQITDLGVIDRNAAVYSQLDNLLNKAVFFLTLGILVPVSEELFMRLYAYTVLREKFNIFLAVFFNTIIFVLFHPIPALIPVIILSNVILCLSYEYTKNILVPVIIHSVVNSYSLFT
jgi:membrane protease YdiL (CAAX protease family)